MKGQILIIEDEKEMVELYTMYLEKEGFTVFSAFSAEDGLEFLKKSSCDLILLDINLPGIDGFEFLQIIRKNNSVPVIIISAREADEDLILGFGVGADEFVMKPVSPKVLIARIRSLFRRLRELSTPQDILAFGPFTLDVDAYILKKDGVKISLSTKEFDVLSFLTSHAGKTVSAEQIYNQVWKAQYGDITIIAVYIQRLRKKLEEDLENPEYIETVYGKGYRFNKEKML